MTFGDIPLQSLLDRIKQKHNLQNTKKVHTVILLRKLFKQDVCFALGLNNHWLFFRNSSEMLCLATSSGFWPSPSPTASPRYGSLIYFFKIIHCANVLSAVTQTHFFYV